MMNDKDAVEAFGFHPAEIGRRHRSWWVIEIPDDDDLEIGALSGYLCVRSRDGGSNDLDADAIRKENFFATREDDFDCTYRYYWFNPISAPQPREAQP